MNPTGHVLIIDDEATLRQTLARVLQRAGFEVTTAASAEEGLAALAAAHVDLVYMDIRMPGMNGLEALKLIRSGHPGLPVVLFTAQPDLSSAVNAVRYGATDYLLKPLKPQTLIESTQTILAGQQKERRKRQIESQIESLQAVLKGLDVDEKNETAASLPAAAADERFLQRGKMTIDLHTRRLTLGGRVINLPPTSFDYLVVLARHAPNVVDCQTLVAEAQGYEAEAREAQELTKWHIHHIRQAIEPDAHNPLHVITVRGSGYRLVTD